MEQDRLRHIWENTKITIGIGTSIAIIVASLFWASRCLKKAKERIDVHPIAAPQYTPTPTPTGGDQAIGPAVSPPPHHEQYLWRMPFGVWLPENSHAENIHAVYVTYGQKPIDPPLMAQASDLEKKIDPIA